MSKNNFAPESTLHNKPVCMMKSAVNKTGLTKAVIYSRRARFCNIAVGSFQEFRKNKFQENYTFREWVKLYSNTAHALKREKGVHFRIQSFEERGIVRVYRLKV
jgi:hypothetical protein